MEAKKSEDQTDNLEAFNSGSKALTPQLIESVLKILPTLSCTVTNTLNWKEIVVGESFTLEIDEDHLVKGKSYIFSSEHLVIFAYMHLPGTQQASSSGSEKRKSSLLSLGSSSSGSKSAPPLPLLPPRRIRVIIKYSLSKVDAVDVKVKNIDAEHCVNIIRTYNTMHSYLTQQHKENHFRNIQVVGVCVAESKTKGWLWNSNFAYLWIEQFVPHFQRMWHHPPKLHINLVATTDHKDLMELQKSFFQHNQERFTIADLQGGCKETENGEFEYILCDLEFTNTLQKFGKVGDPFYTNRELITVARKQWSSSPSEKKNRCTIS